MAYNPVNDYKELTASDRPERLIPCIKCKQKITLLSPSTGTCWACYAGWPTITKPAYDLHLHPHYLKTMERLAVWAEAKAVRRAARLADRLAA